MITACWVLGNNYMKKRSLAFLEVIESSKNDRLALFRKINVDLMKQCFKYIKFEDAKIVRKILLKML